MILHLLDSGIASYLIKGGHRAVDRKVASVPALSVAISVITRAELLFGLRKLPPAHRLHVLVQQYLASVETFPWGNLEAVMYADIRHHLITTGQPIGELDMMIAAHALALNATLVTNNTRHYARVRPRLRMENWL